MTDTTHESPDLLPCPFCGGVAKYYHRPDTTGWSNTEWVSCSGDCGASTCMHETKEEAITAWNNRSNDLVQAAVAAERERCARVAESVALPMDGKIAKAQAGYMRGIIAHHIREGGE